MAINVNSESFCRKAYINYHCYGNTMGISAEDMGRITQAWSDRVSSWQATVSDDENEYEFDDTEYANYKNSGREAGIETTKGDQSKTAGQIAKSTTNAVISVAGAVLTEVGKKVATKAATEAATKAAEEVLKGTVTKATAKTLAEKAAVKAAEKAAEEAAKKTGEQAAKKSAEELSKEVSKNAGSSVGCIIGCVMGAATAASYWAGSPNKEEKKACDALQNDMTAAQATLTDSQSEMESMSDSIIGLSDEAQMLNEDTNEEIEEQKTEYDMYMATYLDVQDKIDAGEPLTDSEKELYKEVVGYLGEIGTTIEELSDQTTDEVSELYDEISVYQDGYDTVAESMGQIEGLTDYAASFDETTQIMCYVEGGAQSINAASSGKAAYEAFALASSGSWFFGSTAWAYAFGVMGAAAAVSSGIGAGQQFKWAGEVGTEIEMRKATQDLNTETMDLYSEEIEGYEGWMQGVEDLELEIPDEIAPPEGEGFPVEGEDPNGIESSEFTNYTEILDEMQEGSKVVTENEDGTGKAVIAPQYAEAITTALGLPAGNSGGTFGKEAIPAIISQLVPGISPNDILKVMNGGSLESSYEASLIQTPTGEDTGKNTKINNTETRTNDVKAVINFYKPIFMKASMQGWKC